MDEERLTTGSDDVEEERAGDQSVLESRKKASTVSGSSRMPVMTFLFASLGEITERRMP